MYRRPKLLTFGYLLLALWGLSDSVQAQAQQDIHSPVILGLENFVPSRPVQMRPDGSGLQAVALSGDLTHNGAKGQRYFLRAEPVSGVTAPDGAQFYDLVSYREDADLSTRLVLTPAGTICTNQPGDPACIFRSTNPRWSIDGKHVAYIGYRYVLNADGVSWRVDKKGIYVGDVTFDGMGSPVSIINEHLAVPGPSGSNQSILDGSVSWSGDERIAYTVVTVQRDSTGKIVGSTHSIYVASVPPGLAEGSSHKVLLASGLESQYYPQFSPGGVGRLAFVQAGGGAQGRSDVWAVSIPPAYDGTYGLTATQITNIVGTVRGNPQWSPDADYLAFSVFGSLGPQIYKIQSDGTGKAVKITNSKKQGYVVSQWRR